MIRILAIACVLAALAMPAVAADPPIIINMPSANSKATAAAPNQAKPAGQLPQVVNYPSGSRPVQPGPPPPGSSSFFAPP